MKWTSHPARERGSAGLAVTLLILVIATAAADLMQHGAYGIGSALFLVITLRRFYFPTVYRLDDRSLSATRLGRTRTVDWNEIIDFQHDQRGGMLRVAKAAASTTSTTSTTSPASSTSASSTASAGSLSESVTMFGIEFGTRGEEIIAAIHARCAVRGSVP